MRVFPGYRRRLRWTWLLPCLLLVHATVWTIAVAFAPVPVTARHVVGEFLSTLAIVILSLNLVLATRARSLERGFGGLDKLFASHRVDGVVVASLVLVHFLVIPKSVGYIASKPIGYTTIVLIVTAVLIAVAPRSPWRDLVTMRYQVWKFSHRFMGLLGIAAVTHSLYAPTFVRHVPLLRAYVYGIAALGISCWIYRELLAPRFGSLATEVASTRMLPGNVIEISLAQKPDSFERRAGQFAFVSFAEGPSREQHPFTISSSPGKPVRFSVKASGDYTDSLTDGLPTGGGARLEGPYGGFDWRAGGPRQLWLAGGIGITPFLAFLGDIDPEVSVVLVWSVRKPADAFYAEEIRAAAEKKPNVQVIIRATQAEGHLRIADLALPGFPGGYTAFVCGPVRMRAEFVRQLWALGMRRRDIHFEEFTLR